MTRKRKATLQAAKDDSSSTADDGSEHIAQTTPTSLVSEVDLDQNYFALRLRQLSGEFRQTLAFAKEAHEDLNWKLNNAVSRADVESMFRGSLGPLAGPSGSYRELIDQLLPGRPLEARAWASLCGFYLRIEAARLTVRLSRRRPLHPLLEMLRAGLSSDRRNDRWYREAWNHTIVPLIKSAQPKNFTRDGDAWTIAQDQAVACDVLAEVAIATIHRTGAAGGAESERPAKTKRRRHTADDRAYELFCLAQDREPTLTTYKEVFRYLSRDEQTSRETIWSFESFCTMVRRGEKRAEQMEAQTLDNGAGRSIQRTKDR